jgi:hypothetical protein
MGYLKCEKGSALLISVFLILLFTVLGFTISAMVVNSAKQASITEDRYQGKVLAEMGIQHVKKELERRFPSRESLKVLDINADDYIRALKDGITVTLSGTKNSYTVKAEETKWTSSNDLLPEGTVADSNIPYVLRLKIKSTGTPANNSASPRTVTATLYLNTVPKVFHYAVATPNELRLFGGSNIFGNVYAGSKLALSPYVRITNILDDSIYKVGQPGDGNVPDANPENKPYIQGFINIPKDGFLYKVKPNETDSNYSLLTDSTTVLAADATRQRIQAFFRPLGSPQNGVPIYPSQQYEAGYEAPFIQVEKSNVSFRDVKDMKNPTDSTSSVAYLIDKKLKEGKESSSTRYYDLQNEQFILIKDKDDFPEGFDITSSAPLYLKMGTTGTPPSASGPGQVPIVQLSGDRLKTVPALYIESDSFQTATINLGTADRIEPKEPTGTSDSLSASGSSDNTPFTFNGAIYVKGDVDILGDINVNGTIFVDGNVFIDEMKTVQNQNLVIFASGSISFANRYQDPAFSTYDAANYIANAPSLNAFLYSDKNIELYAYDSVIKINGGLFGGSGTDGYIELNARRKGNSGSYSKGSTRLTVNFNRSIFEKPTIGMPSSDITYVDVFDLVEE